MPDLVTHAFAAYLIIRWWQNPAHRAVFYLGTFLPDLLSRPIYILFPQLNLYTVALHTPIAALIACLLLAEFFAAERGKIRWLLCGGAALHYFLDLMQRHLDNGYFWGFPLTWKSGELGWFWPETPLRLIWLWLLGMAMIEVIIALRRRQGRVRREPAQQQGDSSPADRG